LNETGGHEKGYWCDDLALNSAAANEAEAGNRLDKPQFKGRQDGIAVGCGSFEVKVTGQAVSL
jgi:hypothetical protein